MADGPEEPKHASSKQTAELASDLNTHHQPHQHASAISKLYTGLSVFLLFLNFFLAQYDKFILSYFQDDVIKSLNLTSIDYGVLSGYATSIVFALLAIPVAFVADYTEARVWCLSVSAVWWSLCVLFQGLSRNFWQILLARIGMGIGQAPVEALSISLISDLVEPKWLFLAESLFYVSVYVGEAVSGQIATAFNKTNTPWNDALKAIGVVGVVLALLTRAIMREPERRSIFAAADTAVSPPDTSTPVSPPPTPSSSKLSRAKAQFSASVSQVIRLRSFWLLTLSSGARQFSGNVFGWYMPSYLSSIYPDEPNLLSYYGIIVGVVGSAAVVLGGLICSASASSSSSSSSSPITRNNSTRATTGLLLTAIGGMLSAAFVVLMVCSLRLAGSNNQSHGTTILYASMSLAYLTAELWLGAFASILALLLPPRTKTFCLAIYTSTIILIYSSAPEMIGLSLRNYPVGSEEYVAKTREILAVLIPVGYWVAGVGFLAAVGKVRADLAEGVEEGGLQRVVGEVGGRAGVAGGRNNPSLTRKMAFAGFGVLLASLTVALFAVSLTIKGLQ